jgi:hypothetical protein
MAITLYLRDTHGAISSYEAGETILEHPLTPVAVRSDNLPGVDYALYPSRDVYAFPAHAGDATPEWTDIPGGRAIVLVAVGRIRRTGDVGGQIGRPGETGGRPAGIRRRTRNRAR